MPLARIVTRTPEDASAIHRCLVDHGYRVEYADPASLVAESADLEINLDHSPVEEGLRLAQQWAEVAGADVYVAPGAVPEQERPLERPAEITSYVPLTFTQEPAPKQPSAFETEELPEEEVPVTPSLLERWRMAFAERRVAREMRKEREREAARFARERQAQARARASARAHERKEQREREAAVRAAGRPRPAVLAGSGAPAPQIRPAQQLRMQPVLERRRGYQPRRDAHHDDEAAQYWRGAFTGASVVAVVLMIAWATLATSRPPASGMNSGQIKQDVPFGPVTLTPAMAPKRATALPSPQKPVSHSMTQPPKPAPVRIHRTRHASSGGVVDDEVMVYHYGTPKPSPTTSVSAKSGVPKRISDDQ